MLSIHRKTEKTQFYYQKIALRRALYSFQLEFFFLKYQYLQERVEKCCENAINLKLSQVIDWLMASIFFQFEKVAEKW